MLAARPTSPVRMLLVFFCLLGLFNGIYQLEKRLSGCCLDLPYTRLVVAAAEMAAWALLPFPVQRRGDMTLGSERASIVVRGGCSGIEALFLMLAGVLALPAPWNTRLKALAVYLPLLFLLNLLRVLMLLCVVVRHPELADLFHNQIGQAIMVVFVLACWVRYVDRLQT